MTNYCRAIKIFLVVSFWQLKLPMAFNGLIRKLSRTTWGASPSVLKIFAQVPCYSVSEYCVPVWGRSAHTPKINIQLRQEMRIIAGTLKSDPLPWLPTLSCIAPPYL